MSTKKVHDAHIRRILPALHGALIEIASTMNRPEQDASMLAEAGLSLERALFPLLVLIGRLGPIGVVDLAGRVGRDYTTVSRQVGRLEELELVTRRAASTDKRVREAEITPRGQRATDAVDAARERMALSLFADWTGNDLNEVTRLLQRLAETMGKLASQENESSERMADIRQSAKRRERP